MAGALREIFARFGVAFDDRELKRGEETVNKVKKKFIDLGSVIASGFAIGGVVAFVDETIRMGNEIRKAAEQVGATTDEIQAISLAFRSVGLDTDDVADSIATLQEKAMDAADGTEGAKDAFKKLGVEYKDSQGNLKSGIELFRDVAEGLKNMSDESERTGIAMTLMEEPGRKMIPIMKDGRVGLEAYAKEIEELGGGATPKFFAAITEVSGAANRFQIVTTGLSSRIVTMFLPAITRATEVLTKVGVAIVQVIDKSNILEIVIGILGAAFIALGVKATIAFAGPIATIGLVAAAIAVVALLVDDLIVTFQGGESVLQGFIDELFGFGTTALVVKAVTMAWEDFVAAIDRAVVAVRSFLAPFGLLQEAGFARTERAARAIEGEEVLTGGRIVRERRGAREIAGEELLDPTRQAQLLGRGLRQVVTPTSFEEMAETAGQSAQRARGVQRPSISKITTGAPVIGEGGRIIGREAPTLPGGAPVTVGDSTVNLTINAADASAGDVARIAARELEIVLARQRRQTIAAMGAEGAGT